MHDPHHQLSPHTQARVSRRTLLAATSVASAVVTAGAAPAVAGTAQHRPDRDARLKKLIARMSLEQKVGQLFVHWFSGYDAHNPEPAHAADNLRRNGYSTPAEIVKNYHLGGVIYFGWSNNVRNPRQLGGLSNDLQKAALSQPNSVPLVVSIDQEHGGIVTRVGLPATQLPGAMALGASGSRGDTRTAAFIAGTELAAMGIRENYAPVADVNVNPANPVIGIRSFGSDPTAAARLVAAQVDGYQAAGVSACAKHFPGHGDTGQDSHTELPVITHTRAEWERLDAPPFRAAIKAGIDSIMTAHLQVAALDPSNDPATLSKPIITGILREELGFDGVIVTDALNMRGVRTKYGDERIPVLALKAGVDQLLFPESLPIAWNAVVKAVRDGELTEARIEESVLRILRLKEKRGMLNDPVVSLSRLDRVVGNRKHRAAADRITDDTTTLLVNQRGALPLSKRRQKNVLVVGVNPASPTGTDRPGTTVAAETLSGLGFSATAIGFTGNAALTPAAIEAAVADARGRDAVVVHTSNVGATSPQRTLVAELVKTGVPVVHLAVGNPYDIAQLSGVAASVASYGWTETEVRSAARVIAGKVDPEGRLPVPVLRADNPAQELYRVGHGLSYDD
ncbi:glycoside hydrolase family 3 protein [Streptomyces sp. NPDC006798]|uniref:glycoside hydrolase family 3 protein n=1 Tax=Streptomyces sp. NPDC006798 TaxID=3155462 RepID=UPI00340B2292